MADLPPDSAGGFEMRPRLNEEMEYFKEMALQETEKWIELVTKRRFKYPEDPRRSLQDGILLCELVNVLKPGSVRKINRLPTPIAFLDNLTVFQNACRSEFGMQDSQLFDIKDLEDLSLRGVLESEEDIQVETARRLKNVAITIFWLGKAVRRWYKGPMLDFAAFTDIIDMSHSSQASFRTPSEASFVSSSAGRFSTDRYSSSKSASKQSDMAYERVAKYLESKPVYGYQTSYDYQEPATKSGAQRAEAFQRPGSDFEEEYFGGSVDSGDMYRPFKVSPKQTVPLPARDGDVRSRGSAAFQTRTNGTLDISPKSQPSDSSHVFGNEPPGHKEGYVGARLSDRTSSPESLTDRKEGVRLSLGSPRADGVRSPASPGTAVILDPLQFVKGDSSALAVNAKQTMQLLQQQQQQQHQGVRQLTMTQEDDNWEAKLSDWKSRRRSQTKSQTTSETDDAVADNRVGVRSDDLPKHQERQSSTVPQASTPHTTEPTSPTRTVIKKREQEEDMLAVFGFTKIPEKPARKPKLQRTSPEDMASQRDSVETNQWKAIQNQEAAERKESERLRSDERIIGTQRPPLQHSDAVESTATMPGSSSEGGSCRSTAGAATESTEQKRRYLEKVIKISQRPKHHKGFGFLIKGGKEFGMPITVDKVHLGGAADVCDLMVKDEIVAINGAQLANHYLESVRAVIDQAVHCGQVELTIRRILSDKSFDESESDVFAEEDLVFDVDQNADETDSKLLEMLELEKDRPATPVPPPEDEPPPLPAAPPPVPNWNTFPGSQAAFCPAGDIQYFDDAEPSQENLRQEEVTSSKPVPLMAAEKDGVHQRTISETSAEKVEVPVQRSDAEKFDMLMKRIHFFGLKPEESEEYRKAMEEKNSKQVRPEVQEIPRSSSSSGTMTKSPVVQSDERMFAVVVKPCEAPPPPPHQTPASQKTSSEVSNPLQSSSSIPSSNLEIHGRIERHDVRVEEREVVGKTEKGEATEFQGRIEQHNVYVEEREVERKTEKVEPTSREKEEEKGKSLETKQLSPSIDREKFFAECGKSVPALKRGNKIFDSREAKGEAHFQTAAKSHNNRFESRDQQQHLSISKETTHADWTKEPCKDPSTPRQSSVLSEKKSTSNEEEQNVEVKLCEKPKDAVDSQHCPRENFPQSLETSKAWRSMEMLRSLSVSDAVVIDPTVRAREDYLSLMMDRPKLSLEQINRQYFDRDSDLKRMEEWHKKQEQLRQEKFDRDQEEIRLKHEAALMEATVLEKEKQKQEEQMLEKDIIWKHQLEEIQQQREKELAKKQKEERELQRLAAEKAERERQRQRERQIESERDTELERKVNELFSFTETCQLRDSVPQKQLPSGVAVEEPDDVKVGKVEIQFIDSAPTRANLEVLSDSMHASSESLASSSQLEFYQGEGANGRNMETITEREQGAFSTGVVAPSTAVKPQRNGNPTREVGNNLWKDQPEGGTGVTYSLNPVANSKPVVTVQKTKSEWSAEAERSAQLIRDEALSISRRAGGGSQWLGPDAEEYLQMSKPEPVIYRTVPVNPSPEPLSSRTAPVNPSPTAFAPNYQFPQQQQQQQPVMRRIIPANPSPEPVMRRNVPLNPSPASLPSSHPFPQQQQPWNRKLLQDISAPPKHRLQDSESWIIARQDDDEVDDVRRSQEIERQVAPVAMRAPPSKPSVPVRTDSLKQTTPTLAGPPTGLNSALTSGARQPRSSNTLDGSGEVQVTNLWQAGYSNISSGSSQENLGAAGGGTRWPTSTVLPIPDSFDVPAPSNEHSANQSCNSQSRGTLNQLPIHPAGGSDPLVFPRYSEVGPMAGTHPPEVRLRSHELPLRSASYNVPQPSKTRPYSCDLSQFSSSVSAQGAVPYQRSLRDPTPLEPTSEAVSLLFDYHRSPPKDDVARLSLDIGRSHGPRSLESSRTSTSDGGQKCAGCDSDLGFGRCIVLDSLDFCFHPGCFKCSVCRCPLRSQSLRDEFRILASKLHCRNCYTNEQEGLKYSKV